MFVPSHITGFFKIYNDNNKDILQTGSIGAGITLNKGVDTTITKGDNEIYFNNKKINLCPTIEVINQCNINNYKISHKSDFPLSSGLGVSGACALGVANLLNKDNNKNNNSLEMAHISEVKCGTGLGDVIAQRTKGFVVRELPGVPNFKTQKVQKISIKNIDNYTVVVEILGKKETSQIINNPQWIEKINKIGDELLLKLLKNPTLHNFMDLSYYFAKNTGLATDKIINICNDLNFTVGASQAMLGNTVFCICENKDLNDVLSILNNPIICKIYQ
ncbi:pantoate kinase [Methanococcus aeolicus]|uniref:pantoate kinase n=1 Tax=Methanococcus aeolicus TaxID=42879 RepID=UPI0021C73A9C|nr:pantoate kinase [Methanococcus aeolicus]UXM84215.1 pantoate kinase [Methanococcus aeolicus]